MFVFVCGVVHEPFQLMLNMINSSFYEAEENISMIESSIVNYSFTHYLINQFMYFHNQITADKKTADFKGKVTIIQSQ